jgi:3-oxoacyl-[acyl-carrier protein] reductase
MYDLGGKVALVTGGARGVGRQYALRLAREGAAVGVIDLNLYGHQDPAYAETLSADTVIDEIRNIGVPAAGIEADLTDSDAVDAAVTDLVSQLGDFDILVANAGGGGWGPPRPVKVEQPASDLDPEGLKRRVEGNLMATAYTVRAVAPSMKRKRYGKIVTVGSISGLFPRPDGSHADYGAAKAAIVFYTKSLAQELGPYNINVNCIALGLTTTERIARKYADEPDSTVNIALRRLTNPEECANIVAFLCSDESSIITSSVIEAHGGTRVPRWGPPPEPWWEEES